MQEPLTKSAGLAEQTEMEQDRVDHSQRDRANASDDTCKTVESRAGPLEPKDTAMGLMEREKTWQRSETYHAAFSTGTKKLGRESTRSRGRVDPRFRNKYHSFSKHLFQILHAMSGTAEANILPTA